MPKIINSVDLNRMQAIEWNKDLINLEYLKNTGNEITAFISELFFNGKDTDPQILAEWQRKLEILNHTIALPYKIATTKAKYFGKPSTNLEVKDLKEQVISYVYGGFCVFAIDETDENNRPIINKYNPEQYVKGIEYDMVVTYLQDENFYNYVFVKEFPNDKSGIVRNKLYKVTGTADAWLHGIIVPLDTLDQTAHLQEEDDFGVNEKLLYTVHDYKLKNRYYWTAQFDMIKPLLNQLNIELVNVKDQLMKHLQAKLAIQWVDAAKMPRDAQGYIDIRAAEAIFLETGAAVPEYIQNKNELLKDALEIIQTYIAQIASIVSVPKELVSINGQTGSESTESKLLRYSDFVKDIEEIHDGFKDIFYDMFQVVTAIDKNYLEDNTKETEFLYIPEPVMPRDWSALATELATARTGGFISNYTAVKRYTGFDGIELEEELARIQEEEAKSIANTSIF